MNGRSRTVWSWWLHHNILPIFRRRHVKTQLTQTQDFMTTGDFFSGDQRTKNKSPQSEGVRKKLREIAATYRFLWNTFPFQRMSNHLNFGGQIYVKVASAKCSANILQNESSISQAKHTGPHLHSCSYQRSHLASWTRICCSSEQHNKKINSQPILLTQYLCTRKKTRMLIHQTQFWTTKTKHSRCHQDTWNDVRCARGRFRSWKFLLSEKSLSGADPGFSSETKVQSWDPKTIINAAKHPLQAFCWASFAKKNMKNKFLKREQN